MKHLRNRHLLGSAALLLSLVPVAWAGVDLSVGIVIKNPPPAPRREVIVTRPSPRHIWAPGYWHWEGGRHVWVAGCWELPPREHVIYVPAHWDHRPDGYVFVAGEWQDAPVTSTIETTTTAELIVSQAPPPPPAEQIPGRPSPTAVWLSGYWRWGSNAYEWTPGQWAEPPTPTCAFIAPHWEARDNGYAFIPGCWRETGTVAVPTTPAPTVIVTDPPPPVVREVIIERPSRYHVWVAGNWYWHGGRYVWSAGHWELPPRRHAHYEPPRWEHRDRGYIMVEGHWR